MSSASWCLQALDSLGALGTREAALERIDALSRQVAGPGIFSIQQNVTTAQDPRNEVRLTRLYSTASAQWPAGGSKRKTRTDWTETLFVRGEVVVCEGGAALERHFDDYAQMRALELRRAVNIPILMDTVCIATFNVFGTQDTWHPEQLAGLRMLALAAARWLSPAPGLDYRFDVVAPSVAPADHVR